MRVIFMGTPDFAVPTLQALVDAGHEVVLVVAQPDRRSGRGKKLVSPPTIQRARELGLPTSQPRAIRAGSFPARVQGLQADVAVVIAYGRILTQELLDAPRFGCVNVHASLLPRWRGAAPIQASILAGDPTTGVCTQRMVAGLDEGDLYLCLETPIGERESAGELHDRLSELSAQAAVQTLERLGEHEPMPQEGEPTYVGKIDRADGELDWTRSAAELDRKIRAYSPWPGGWVAWAKGPLKVLRAHPVKGSGEPGTVLATQPDLIIATGDGGLALDQVRAPGRKAVAGRDLANGLHLAPGAPLQPPE
ncbi:MAG: methionyl-tRNA formyltransferase [Myxococcota bacterium]